MTRGLVLHPIESVEIQLPLERRELGLVEILGQDILDEFVSIIDDESLPVRQP